MPSRRQLGSEERRRRVLRAATALIGERPQGGFSMQELARLSGVSLATPYNLFGSKAAVLGHVFARQITGFQERDSSRDVNSADGRLVGVVDQLLVALERNPVFFRNLWRALASLSPTEHRDLIVPVSNRLLQPFVAGLIADRLIGNEIAAETIATTLVGIFNANFEQWASQDWSVADLRRQLLAGFALCLLGLVRSGRREPLLRLAQDAGTPGTGTVPPACIS